MYVIIFDYTSIPTEVIPTTGPPLTPPSYPRYASPELVMSVVPTASDSTLINGLGDLFTHDSH